MVKQREIVIRSDNGSQFIAGAVRRCLSEVGIKQEFTRVATPEENGRIEAFRSIVEEEVIKRREFESLKEANDIFDRYNLFYNNERIHWGIGFKTPSQFLLEYYQKNGVLNNLERLGSDAKT